MVMKNNTFIGIVLIAAGLLKLADMWDIVRLDWLWQQAWTDYICPALLLYVGFDFIIGSYRRHRDRWLRRPVPFGEDGKRIHCKADFGGDEYVYRGEPFHGAWLDCFCGGIRLDLREATITEDEEIDIHTMLGGVELLVPRSVKVQVNSRSLFGGVGNETENCDAADAPCLHIVASNILGGVSISNA